MRKVIWFFRLVWQPWHGGPITIREAWKAACILAGELRHPGYITGNHWLETAYDRICAGENEEEVLRDCGWVRTPAEPKCSHPCYGGVLITKVEVDTLTYEETREFGPCPMCNQNDMRGLVVAARDDWRLSHKSSDRA